MALRSFSAHVIGVCAGLLVAGTHFMTIYIFHALACARGFASFEILGIGVVSLAIAAATVLAIAATLFVAWQAVAARPEADVGLGGSGNFLRWLTVAMAGLGGVAILWGALPALIVPACR
jgi:hypothetical protein